MMTGHWAVSGLAVHADSFAELLLGVGSTLSVIVYFIALGALALYGLHRLWLTQVVRERASRTADERTAPTAPAPTTPAEWPTVTVQCPLYDEPDVAARLVDAACALDYPRESLEVQVLDDSDDETTEIVQRRIDHHRATGVDVKIVRRDDRTGFKAGALGHGLALARGELIAIFDADFVPRPDFLRRTVPAFDDDRIGLVQARWGHLNRERSWLTRLQALLLDGHFLVEHAGRAAAGRFFNFNGTAGVFRRQCIEDAGGWEHDTLTEDLDLSYRAQLAGWRFVFLDDVVAPAELPCDVNAWKSQQRRWTKGSVQSARKLLPRIVRAPLAPGVKLEALLHLTNNVAYPLLLALAVTTFPAAVARQAWGWGPLVLVEIPLLLGTTGAIAAFYALAARRGGERVTEAWRLLPALIALGVGSSLNSTRAVFAGLRRGVGEFVRTPKSGDVALSDESSGDSTSDEGTSGAAAQGPATGRYRFGADAWARVEIVAGLVLACEAVAAIALGLWPTVPFLSLFAAGFLAVGVGSLTRPRAVVAPATS